MWIVVQDCIKQPDKRLVVVLEEDKSKMIFVETDSNFSDLNDTACLIAKALNKRDKFK